MRNNKFDFRDFIAAGGLCPVDGGQDDLFVACASFEERSRASALCLSKSYRARRVFLYVNREFQDLPETRSNIEFFQATLKSITDDFSGIVSGSWERADEQFRVLRDGLAPAGVVDHSKSITLDITTFNREALLSALAILRWAYPRGRIRLVHVTPEEYNRRGRQEFERIRANLEKSQDMQVPRQSQYVWLSRGFRKLRNAIGFPGEQKPLLPSLLILLPGFEVERALTIVENQEPSRVLLGRSVDHMQDVFHRRHLESKAAILQLLRGRQPVEEFDFSCTDIRSCEATLESIVCRHREGNNIFVAPMCAKIGVVATYLVAERHPEVQVTYCVPGEYNVHDYSSGMSMIAYFDLPPRISDHATT